MLPQRPLNRRILGPRRRRHTTHQPPGKPADVSQLQPGIQVSRTHHPHQRRISAIPARSRPRPTAPRPANAAATPCHRTYKTSSSTPLEKLQTADSARPVSVPDARSMPLRSASYGAAEERLAIRACRRLLAHSSSSAISAVARPVAKLAMVNLPSSVVIPGPAGLPGCRSSSAPPGDGGPGRRRMSRAPACSCPAHVGHVPGRVGHLPAGVTVLERRLRWVPVGDHELGHGLDLWPCGLAVLAMDCQRRSAGGAV